MSLFNFVKESVKLAKDTVDGTLNTAIDAVCGDTDSINKRLFEDAPKRVGKFIDESVKDDET